jgi:hypothetical protein
MSQGRFVLTRIGQTLVVTLEGAADAACLQLAAQALAQETARKNANSVVFEVSACEVMDLDEFLGLRKLMETIEFLGLRSVVAGLRPGIVTYLASAGVSVGRLRTSLDLEHALLDLNAGALAEDETGTDADDDDNEDAEYDHEPDYAGSV